MLHIWQRTFFFLNRNIHQYRGFHREKGAQKMKKSLCLLMLMMIVWSVSLVSGCNETHSYVGESEHWKGTLHLTQSGGKEVEEGTIVYKGKDKQEVKRVIWKVQGMHGERGGNDYLTDGTIRISGSCTGCAMQGKDEPYEVTVEWNGVTETFQVKRR
jgi:hypothetical protein